MQTQKKKRKAKTFLIVGAALLTPAAIAGATFLAINMKSNNISNGSLEPDANGITKIDDFYFDIYSKNDETFINNFKEQLNIRYQEELGMDFNKFKYEISESDDWHYVIEASEKMEYMKDYKFSFNINKVEDIFKTDMNVGQIRNFEDISEKSKEALLQDDSIYKDAAKDKEKVLELFEDSKIDLNITKTSWNDLNSSKYNTEVSFLEDNNRSLDSQSFKFYNTTENFEKDFVPKISDNFLAMTLNDSSINKDGLNKQGNDKYLFSSLVTVLDKIDDETGIAISPDNSHVFVVRNIDEEDMVILDNYKVSLNSNEKITDALVTEKNQVLVSTNQGRIIKLHMNNDTIINQSVSLELNDSAGNPRTISGMSQKSDGDILVGTNNSYGNYNNGGLYVINEQNGDSLTNVKYLYSEFQNTGSFGQMTLVNDDYILWKPYNTGGYYKTSIFGQGQNTNVQNTSLSPKGDGRYYDFSFQENLLKDSQNDDNLYAFYNDPELYNLGANADTLNFKYVSREDKYPGFAHAEMNLNDRVLISARHTNNSYGILYMSSYGELIS